MKKIFKALAFLLVIFVVGVGFFLFSGLKTGASVKVNSIDIKAINDGKYTGSYTFKRWSNELEITVSNSRIVSIKVIDDVTVAKDEIADELFNRVIKDQSLDVDCVAGATVTSKAYLKSIENALINK